MNINATEIRKYNANKMNALIMKHQGVTVNINGKPKFTLRHYTDGDVCLDQSLKGDGNLVWSEFQLAPKNIIMLWLGKGSVEIDASWYARERDVFIYAEKIE